MTQAEIRKKRKELQVRRKEANKQVEIVLAEMRVLWAACDHPKKFATCTMGDSGESCPDCGWGT